MLVQNSWFANVISAGRLEQVDVAIRRVDQFPAIVRSRVGKCDEPTCAAGLSTWSQRGMTASSVSSGRHSSLSTSGCNRLPEMFRLNNRCLCLRSKSLARCASRHAKARRRACTLKAWDQTRSTGEVLHERRATRVQGARARSIGNGPSLLFYCAMNLLVVGGALSQSLPTDGSRSAPSTRCRPSRSTSFLLVTHFTGAARPRPAASAPSRRASSSS